MSRRFVFLGILTLVGLALLALGWRGEVGDLKDVTGSVKPPLGQVDPEVYQKEQTGAGTDKEAARMIKPDTTPSGPAAKVQQEKTGREFPEEGSGFFAEYRLERERSRGYQIQLLREIINNANSDGESRKKAQDQLYVISNNLQKELEVESLIRAKGYRDAVVFLEGETVTVVIQAKALTQEDAMKITDLVARSTGVSQQHIVIIPKA